MYFLLWNLEQKQIRSGEPLRKKYDTCEVLRKIAKRDYLWLSTALLAMTI